MLPQLSVVVPAFNEAGRIGHTLRLVLNYLEREARQRIDCRERWIDQRNFRNNKKSVFGHGKYFDALA